MNEEKTEEFTIKRNVEETWKKCKLLGTLLDTEGDVKRRKVLGMNVVNSMKEIFFGDISIEVKVRSFNCYVSSVFLHNCEKNTRKHDRLDPAKVAENCGSQCQMGDYRHQ